DRDIHPGPRQLDSRDETVRPGPHHCRVGHRHSASPAVAVPELSRRFPASGTRPVILVTLLFATYCVERYQLNSEGGLFAARETVVGELLSSCPITTGPYESQLTPRAWA